jgi:hypothetical protein
MLRDHPALGDTSSARSALRLIQVYDETKDRGYLMAACESLAALLGLVCSGDAEGDGNYDHSADTCPVHEWVDTNDQRFVENYRGAKPPAGATPFETPRMQQIGRVEHNDH